MNRINEVKMLEFSQFGDERGYLVVLEAYKNIPFSIQRAFYIYGSDNSVVRGQHANKESEFVLINVAGQSKVRIRNGHGDEIVYHLNRPHIGLYLPTMIWKDMYDFSEDSVLLVLSNKLYNPDEYIRDYNEFVKLVNGEGKR